MKRIKMLALLMSFAATLQAQNYMIDFAGTGSSTTVDSVKIENLTQCTSMVIGGADILNPSSATGIDQNTDALQNLVNIYPNPSSGYFTVEIESASDNNACIGIYDISGKSILTQNKFLKKGYQKFNIDGIPEGIYIFKIESDLYQYSSKLISNAVSEKVLEIKTAESLLEKSSIQKDWNKTVEMKDNKGGKSVISMLFNAGDTLKLTGKSGNYRTISMLFPIQDQTVTFNFVNCTDADSNHYAVVQIGSQIWMAENLKTTKYRDGSVIPNVPDSATWGSTTSGAWCDFLNDPAEGAYYGHLYNWYAASDSRNIAPVGWHVASNAEWNIMEKFVDNTVDTTALGGTGAEIGRILKEGCNTRWLYYDSTAGWNSAGFTALCTNFRNSSGAWSLAPNNNHDDSFWTATPYNANMAWGKSFRWCTRDIYSLFNFDRAGSSVRCIKDN
jgi:uncharacterized protein (TIGR02145 family)